MTAVVCACPCFHPCCCSPPLHVSTCLLCVLPNTDKPDKHHQALSMVSLDVEGHDVRVLPKIVKAKPGVRDRESQRGGCGDRWHCKATPG